MMQLIGDKIRTLRRKRGLSQEQLGAMVGFSQSKISKIERGERGDWDSLSDLRLCHRARIMRKRRATKPLGKEMKSLVAQEFVRNEQKSYRFETK